MQQRSHSAQDIFGGKRAERVWSAEESTCYIAAAYAVQQQQQQRTAVYHREARSRPAAERSAAAAQANHANKNAL